ncbi:MAG: hypothetical protein AAF810_04850 [Cyanobacteria bacterium P01_D01_bin.36]
MSYSQYSLDGSINTWAQHLEASTSPFQNLISIRNGYASKNMNAGLTDIYKVVDVSSKALAVVIVKESAQLSAAGIGLHVTLKGEHVWFVPPYGHS